MTAPVNVGSIAQVDVTPMSDSMADVAKSIQFARAAHKAAEDKARQAADLRDVAAKGFPTGCDIEQPDGVVVVRPVAVTFKP